MNKDVRDALMARIKTGRGGKVDGEAMGEIRAIVQYVAEDPGHAREVLDSLDLIGEATGEAPPPARGNASTGRFTAVS